MRENLALLSRQKLEDEAKKLVMEDDNTNLLRIMITLDVILNIYQRSLCFQFFVGVIYT